MGWSRLGTWDGLALVHGMVSRQYMRWSRGSTRDGLEAVHGMVSSDALSCTKSNRAYRLILEEVFPRLEGKLSRASKGDLPVPRRETFPRLGGRPSRKAKGRLPARRRETFTQQQPDYSINTKLL